jgi:hypothetical protein
MCEPEKKTKGSKVFHRTYEDIVVLVVDVPRKEEQTGVRLGVCASTQLQDRPDAQIDLLVVLLRSPNVLQVKLLTISTVTNKVDLEHSSILGGDSARDQRV